jgi:hypothetical protein
MINRQLHSSTLSAPTSPARQRLVVPGLISINFHRKTYAHQCSCFEGSPHMSPATPPMVQRQRRSGRTRGISRGSGGLWSESMNLKGGEGVD